MFLMIIYHILALTILLTRFISFTIGLFVVYVQHSGKISELHNRNYLLQCVKNKSSGNYVIDSICIIVWIDFLTVTFYHIDYILTIFVYFQRLFTLSLSYYNRIAPTSHGLQITTAKYSIIRSRSLIYQLTHTHTRIRIRLFFLLHFKNLLLIFFTCFPFVFFLPHVFS